MPPGRWHTGLPHTQARNSRRMSRHAAHPPQCVSRHVPQDPPPASRPPWHASGPPASVPVAAAPPAAAAAAVGSASFRYRPATVLPLLPTGPLHAMACQRHTRTAWPACGSWAGRPRQQPSPPESTDQPCGWVGFLIHHLRNRRKRTNRLCPCANALRETPRFQKSTKRMCMCMCTHVLWIQAEGLLVGRFSLLRRAPLPLPAALWACLQRLVQWPAPRLLPMTVATGVTNHAPRRPHQGGKHHDGTKCD